MSGKDPGFVRREGQLWLERVGLKGWEKTPVSKFSKGMVERLALAQALVHDPDLIFLDEPTDGLDPVGRMDMRQGKTVFINSHILAEIETVCDRVALMKEGRIVDVGTVAHFTSGGDSYEVSIPRHEPLVEWLSDLGFDPTLNDGRIRVVVPDRRSANELIDTLRTRGVEIDRVTPHRRTLEEVFLERVG